MIKYFIKIFLITIFSVFFIIFFGAICSLQYFRSYENKLISFNENMIEIPHNSSSKKVCELLASNTESIDMQKCHMYLRFFRDDSQKIQAGFFEVPSNIILKDLIENFKTGRKQKFKITFPEGITADQIATILDEHQIISKKDFELAFIDDSFLKEFSIPLSLKRSSLGDIGGLEGYLFPDTYFFEKNSLASDIIHKMAGRLFELLTPAYLDQIRESKFNLHQVLTIASIVEKEGKVPHEFDIIASVYLNRIKKGMKLQADPTIIYGLKDYSGRITYKDLKDRHAYNTYVHKGLPPGPIASPGLNAITAVLWPKNTDYLFFVSKNDGTHEFCADLPCHNKAVKKWQIDNQN